MQSLLWRLLFGNEGERVRWTSPDGESQTAYLVAATEPEAADCRYWLFFPESFERRSYPCEGQDETWQLERSNEGGICLRRKTMRGSWSRSRPRMLPITLVVSFLCGLSANDAHAIRGLDWIFKLSGPEVGFASFDIDLCGKGAYQARSLAASQALGATTVEREDLPEEDAVKLRAMSDYPYLLRLCGVTVTGAQLAGSGEQQALIVPRLRLGIGHSLYIDDEGRDGFADLDRVRNGSRIDCLRGSALARSPLEASLGNRYRVVSLQWSQIR